MAGGWITFPLHNHPHPLYHPDPNTLAPRGAPRVKEESKKSNLRISVRW